MKLGRLLALTVLAAGLFLALKGQGYFHQARDFNAADQCDIPIHVRAGDFDSRFPVSEQAFQRALDDAIALWESRTDTPLFTRDASAGLSVSLVYDSRQARANKERTVLGNIEEHDAAIERQERSLSQRRDALDRAWAQFERDRERLKEKSGDMEQLVQQWNNGQMHRTPQNRRMLERQKEELNARRTQLEQQQAQLEHRTEQWRQAVDDHNAAIKALNERAESFNDEVSSDSMITMGEYQRENGERRIEIYRANNARELKQVIAHELGHALGIGHVEDTAAVMNAEMSADNAGASGLTSDDLAALTKACQL